MRIKNALLSLITGMIFGLIIMGSWLLSPQTNWAPDPVTGIPTQYVVSDTGESK
ncbi:hypothetical protein QP222_05600 [Corynebacterium pyruviciproducens]|uniref:hypothetical protein n=1 Tax=Corynebacterium pyruviciproducens TaxID=598660 RepID=UPI00254C2FFF|nr:hypothetical protein [Corynebacterium pyruviciproducens]MDK6565883.1 hypothetical protein [Corynebacterium pyruviciproducens]